jgi:hypothetical protein
MVSSGIFQVVIGLIFIYSLLSILATQINTIIASVLNLRARHLKGGLETLLTDPVIRAKFLAHPLIRMVETDLLPHEVVSAQAAQAVDDSRIKSVTYIAPEIFAQALMDILSDEARDRQYAPLYSAIDTALEAGERAQMRELTGLLTSGGVSADEYRRAVETLADAADRQLVLDALTRATTARLPAINAEASRLIPLLEGANKIADPNLRKAIQLLLGTARSVEEASARLEFWFDTRMEQLTEIYKRNISFISLLVGLTMALVLNIDTILVARTLWDDPVLRDTVARVAQEAIDSGQLEAQIVRTATPFPTLTPTLDVGAIMATALPGDTATTLPGDATPEPPSTLPEFDTQSVQPSATPVSAAPNVPESVVQVTTTVEQILGLNLPIGWAYAPIVSAEGESLCFVDNAPPECFDRRNIWLLLPGSAPVGLALPLLLGKILGMALTAIAVAQGAPFWFDLLNRLVRRS